MVALRLVRHGIAVEEEAEAEEEEEEEVMIAETSERNGTV